MKTYENPQRGLVLTQNEVDALGWTEKDISTYLYSSHTCKTVDAYIRNRLGAKARDVVVKWIRTEQDLDTTAARQVFKDMNKSIRKEKVREALEELNATPQFSMTITKLSAMEDSEFDRAVKAQMPRSKPRKASTTPELGYIYIIVNTHDIRYRHMVKVGRSKRPDSRPGTFFLFNEFDLAHAEPSYDYVKDETVIHQAIVSAGGKRVEGSEWFQIQNVGVDGVIDIIKSKVTLT